MPFDVVRADIATMRVDAVVNAANAALAGGAGVCGAIWSAAGPERMGRACRAIGGCPVGGAVVTPGFDLPARYVIHAVAPVWEGGDHGEASLLASAYRSALDRAVELGVSSVAFPLLGTGAYGYPIREALPIAIATIGSFLREHDLEVTLVTWGSSSTGIAREVYGEVESFIDDEYVEASPFAGLRSRIGRMRRGGGADGGSDGGLADAAGRSPAGFRGSAFPDDADDLPGWAREERYRQAPAGRPDELDDICLAPALLDGAAPAGSCGPSDMPAAPHPASEAPCLAPASALESPDVLPCATSAAPVAPATSAAPRDLASELQSLDAGFAETLLALIDERGLTDAQVYRRANISRQLFNKVKNDPRYKPSKPTVMAFAIALELTMDQAGPFLARAGYAFSRASKFDVIVEYFIRHGNYDILDINMALYSYDQPLLGSNTAA